MSLIQYSIKNMIGGVSQQPPSVRMQNQCDEMINCVPSVTDFLKRRNGTSHIAKLLDTLPDDAFIDFIKRGETETGLLVITGGTAAVYRLDGVKVGETSTDYFLADSQRTALRLLTINDYNFILNTKKKAEAQRTNMINGNAAFIFIKQAAYGTTYQINFNGFSVYHSTLDYDTSFWQLSAETIAKELAEEINTYNEQHGPAFFPEIHATEKGAIILLTGIITELSVDDRKAGQCIKAFYKTTPTFTELPTAAPDGFILEITGDPTTKFDNYYVKFNADGGHHIGEGYWSETTQEGHEYSLIKNSMPQILQITSQSINLAPIYWSPRKVGDDDTCPIPSFIGKCINDIFFYRNRLCFLTDDNVVMSESGEYFNFFKTTATVLLDSDPIDVAISATKVSHLRYGVPYAEGLFLYSDGTLFVAEHGDVLSTASISVRPLLQFDSFLAAKPLVSDVNIFYATSRGQFTQLREYIPNSAGDMYGYSNDITSHIPAYIPKGIRSITVCIEESLLLLTADDGKIYVYKWQNGANGERVQSAWGRWEFSGNVLNAEVINGVLYLVIKYPDGVYLESLILSERNGLLKDRRNSAHECDFVSQYTYSQQFLRQESLSQPITAGRMQLRTIALRYATPSKFNITIRRTGRAAETRSGGSIDGSESRFAVLSNAEHTAITVQSTGADPFRLIETRLEALFTVRTRII